MRVFLSHVTTDGICLKSTCASSTPLTCCRGKHTSRLVRGSAERLLRGLLRVLTRRNRRAACECVGERILGEWRRKIRTTIELCVIHRKRAS